METGPLSTPEELAQREPNKLIASWFHVGEEVGVRDTKARVIVLGYGKQFMGRGGFTHKLAGIYIDFMKIRVASDFLSEQSQYEMRAECLERPHFPFPTNGLGQVHFPKMQDIKIRIGNLPNTPFWVGDKVLQTVSSDPHMVNSVVYNNEVKCEGGMVYSISNPNVPGTEYNQFEKNLTLVERGNVWKLEHGEPLSFPGGTEAKRLYEEAAFYKSLGMSHKVIFEDTEEELWPIGGGIQKLQRGEADRLIVQDKKTQQVVLIKYDNEEFGARMRVAELARLGC